MTAEGLMIEIVMRTVREQFADRLGIGVLSRETRLEEDLNADALDRVELAMVLEDELGLDLDDKTVQVWRTVGDAVDACLAQLG